MAIVLEMISWFFICFSITGAWITSNENPSRRNIKIANGLYIVSNSFNVIFMMFNFHWSYFLKYFIFLIIGIRGVWKNRSEK